MTFLLRPNRRIVIPQRSPRLSPDYDVQFCVTGKCLVDLVGAQAEGAGLSLQSTRSINAGMVGQAVNAAYEADAAAIYPRWTTGPQPGTGDFALLYVGAIPTSANFGFIWSNHGGSNQWRIQSNYLMNGASGATQSGALSLITYDGTFSGVGASGVLDGKVHAYLFRRAGTTHELWVDGVLKASQTLTVRDVSGSKTFGPAMYWNNKSGGPSIDYAANNYAADQDCALFAMLGAVNDPAYLSARPAAIFTAPKRRLFVFASSGTPLVGAASDQANISAAGAVTQDHQLVGASSSQSAASLSGAVGQTHVLAGAASSQANTSATGAETQTHVLAGAPASQANVSAAGALGQTHQLQGAASAQAATDPGGALGQTHVLVGAASTQANTCSTGALDGGITLAGSTCSQANTATGGPIGQTHTLAGASASQAASAGTGAIVQTHALAGAPSVQANTSSTGSIAGGATLVGAPCSQANASSAGAVGQTHMLVAAPSVQDNVAAASAIVQAHVLGGQSCDQANQSPGAPLEAGHVQASPLQIHVQHASTRRHGRIEYANGFRRLGWRIPPGWRD